MIETICPTLIDTKINEKKKAKINPGFFNVFEWNGAQCNAATIPRIRKHDANGIWTKADLQLFKQFSLN